jgi:hypothetical protein
MQENQPVGRSDENSNTHTQTLHDIEPISVTTPDEPVAVHAAEFTHLGVDLTTLALRTIALMDPSNSANHNRQKLVETPPDAANGRFWLQLLTLAQHHASFDEQFARQVAGTVDVEDVGQQLALMVQRRRIEIIENDQEQIRYKLTNLSHKLLADVPSSPISTTPDRHFRPQPTNKFLQGLRSLDPDIFDFGRGAINLMQWIWITVITDQLATRWAARPTYWYIDAIFGIVYLSLGAILLTGIIGINFYMIAAVLLIINWGERQLRRQITAR